MYNAWVCPLVHRYTLPANAAPSACAVPFCIDLTPGLFDHILRLTRQHAEAFKRGVEGGTHYPLTACLRIAGGVVICSPCALVPPPLFVSLCLHRVSWGIASHPYTSKFYPCAQAVPSRQKLVCVIPSCTPCVPSVPVHSNQSCVCVCNPSE